MVASAAAMVMMIGVLLVALGLESTGRISENHQPWYLIGGVSAVMIGVTGACAGFILVITRKTASLVLHINGLMYTTALDSHWVTWRNIDSISAQNNTVTLQINPSGSLQIDAKVIGTKSEQLAERLAELKRLVLLGTIR